MSQLAKTSALAILIFLITDKVCSILCELASRILLINKVTYPLYHFLFFGLIIGLSFWLFVWMYDRWIKSNNIKFSFVLSLLFVYLALVMWMILWPIVGSDILPLGEMLVAKDLMSLYGYSKGMPKLLFLLQIAFLLFRIKKK